MIWVSRIVVAVTLYWAVALGVLFALWPLAARDPGFLMAPSTFLLLGVIAAPYEVFGPYGGQRWLALPLLAALGCFAAAVFWPRVPPWLSLAGGLAALGFCGAVIFGSVGAYL